MEKANEKVKNVDEHLENERDELHQKIENRPQEPSDYIHPPILALCASDGC